MILEPPLSYYIQPNSTHCYAKDLEKRIGVWKSSEISEMLIFAGYLTKEGKITQHALKNGIVDLCEKKPIWNIRETKKALIAVYKSQELQKAAANKPLSNEEKWVDLNTVGTYFGVSNIVIGRWLDSLGFRELPKKERNSSGDYDMLDFANEAKEKQANGFISKQPTDKALNGGLARKLTVTNRKQKEIEIVQWNLELCKKVLVRAGHELDTEHKMILKGKGKNSDVKVITVDDRAKELFQKWKSLHDSKERWRVFENQPKPVLLKVEILMNRPGYLINKEYLKDPRIQNR